MLIGCQCTDESMDGWMNGWVDGWMSKLTDRWSDTYRLLHAGKLRHPGGGTYRGEFVRRAAHGTGTRIQVV
jgi:hypothetical protein